jgi:hypothetical protein
VGEELTTRVARVEERLGRVEADVAGINAQLGAVATKTDIDEVKADVQEVRRFFEVRDDLYTRNLWRLAFGLIIAICAIAFAFVGVREIPKLFI